MDPDTISIDAARQILVKAAVQVKETNDRMLLDSCNCVLANSIHSAINVPSVSNSAMDGYAVKAETSEGKILSVSQRIPAGVCPSPLEHGTTARIFTGAPLPEGANAVVIQEKVSKHKGALVFPEKILTGQNVRQVGEDIRSGDQLFPSGHRLRPQDIGLLASVGLAIVSVRRPIKVAVCSTGDELVEPGVQKIKFGETYNSNRFVISTLLKSWGMEVLDYGILGDDPVLISEKLLEASNVADSIVTSGGMSVGEEDHVKAQISNLGELKFWRLRIKPGKPFAFGHIGSTPILGLPGNPVSAFVTFLLLAKPFLFIQQGDINSAPRYVRATANFEIPKTSDREQYLRVRVIQSDLGLGADVYPNQGSGVFSSICSSDALARLPPNTKVYNGDKIELLMLDSLVGP